jgi:tripartite-type tricarboxylate transporter receptor subunit TctC
MGSAGVLEICLLTWPSAEARASEPPLERAASAQVAVETKPSTDAAVSATAATQIVVPCPLGSPADLAARHIAKVLSEHDAHDYQVKNLLPDAARQMARQPDSQAVLFIGTTADGIPVCGD